MNPYRASKIKKTRFALPLWAQGVLGFLIYVSVFVALFGSLCLHAHMDSNVCGPWPYRACPLGK